MNTAAAPPCQTAGREKLARRTRRFVAMAGSWMLFGATSRGALVEPPPWQNELNALRLADAAVATRGAGGAEADRRLGELFHQLAARYPREAAIHKAAGDHFWRTGDTGTATDEWEAAQTIDPSDAETASALGSARLREGKLRPACEEFQRAVAARPGTARYHFDLANVLYLFRHELTGLPGLPDEAATVREALAQYRSARDLAPDSVEFARAYAETFYGVPAPDWHEALQAWEHVLTLSTDAPDFSLAQLARVSLKLGQPDGAERYLEKMRDPGFAPLRATLRRQAAAQRQAKPGPP